MNEDINGITPANVTAMTLERNHGQWRLTIERGNGDSVQTLNLTEQERMTLACLLEPAPAGSHSAMQFVDLTREADGDHPQQAAPQDG